MRSWWNIFSISSRRAERIKMPDVCWSLDLAPFSMSLERDLFLVWVYFAVGTALLGQLEGCPNSLALDAFEVSSPERAHTHQPPRSVWKLAPSQKERGIRRRS